MGSLQASEFAQLADLDTALRWHLQHNHYPPVPLSMLSACKVAISAIQDGEPSEKVQLPNGVYALAIEIVRAYHLDPFINDDVED